MLRYLRLFGYFVRFSFSRAMEFRLDFFFRIVMDLFFYAVNIGFYKVVFLQTPLLAGWSEPQVMIFVAGYLVIDAINMTLFSNNMWMFPILVNRGDLDYYLLRPVSSLFFMSLRDFAANSFVNLVMTLGILGWAIARSPESFSLARTAGFGLLLINGTYLYYLLAVLFVVPVFWTHSGSGFRQVYWSLNRLTERPDGIFTGWARRILITVLPFCLMASFPARLFLEGFEWGTFLHLAAVTLAFTGVLALVWGRALRSYSSASS